MSESKWTPFVGQPVPHPTPTLEQQLRAVAAFAPSDVAAIIEQALSRISELVVELKESQRLTRKAVDEHANCETEIHLRALTIQKKNSELSQLREQLDEANRMWNGAMEVQAELESQQHTCPHPCDSCKEFERSRS